VEDWIMLFNILYTISLPWKEWNMIYIGVHQKSKFCFQKLKMNWIFSIIKKKMVTIKPKKHFLCNFPKNLNKWIIFFLKKINPSPRLWIHLGLQYLSTKSNLDLMVKKKVIFKHTCWKYFKIKNNFKSYKWNF
jgi:hypothetical protein